MEVVSTLTRIADTNVTVVFPLELTVNTTLTTLHYL